MRAPVPILALWAAVWTLLPVAGARPAAAATPAALPDSAHVRLAVAGDTLTAAATLVYAAAAAGGEAAFELDPSFRIAAVRVDGREPAWREEIVASGARAVRRCIVSLPPPSPTAKARGAPRVAVEYAGPRPDPGPWSLRLEPQDLWHPAVPGAAPLWVVDLADVSAAAVGGTGTTTPRPGGGARLAPPLRCAAPVVLVSTGASLPWQPAGGIPLACVGPGGHPADDALRRRLERLLARACADWGPWPWDSLLVVAGAPGLEHARAWPGVIELSAAAAADTSLAGEAGLYHELLHGWFGMAVRTPARGDWSEGLCALLADHDLRAERDPALAARLRRDLLFGFAAVAGGPHDVPLTASQAGDPEAAPVLYGKSLFCHLALREALGAPAHAAALRRLVARHAGRELDWRAFCRVLREAGGPAVSLLGEVWLEARGAPRLAPPRFGYDRARREIRLTLAQLPTGRDPVWPLRLPARLDGLRAAPLRLEMSRREQTWRVPAPMAPAGVTVDPDWEVFRLVTGDGALVAVPDAAGR